MSTHSNNKRPSWTPVLFLLVTVPTAVYFTMPDNSPKFWAFVQVMRDTYDRNAPKPNATEQKAKDAQSNSTNDSRTALLPVPAYVPSTATEPENTQNNSDTTRTDESNNTSQESSNQSNQTPTKSTETNSNETNRKEPESASTSSTSESSEQEKPKPKLKRKKQGKPVEFVKRTVKGVPLYAAIVDLEDPDAYITVGLANNAEQANDQYETHGDEAFESMVRRAKGAVVMNGTFFSKDNQKRVMGNLITEGKVRKYSQFENLGTTLGLKEGNVPEMTTARVDAQPNWRDHWFSVTCGPRLLKEGEVWVYPEIEGFSDDHVWTVGPRNAIGYSKNGKKLYLVSFLRGLSLEREAELMRELGCYEAMNLDGGASRALSHNGSVLIKASRPLTNVLVVYDTQHKAPSSIVESWDAFQEGQRPDLP